MITIENEGHDIFVFGRDELGKEYIIEDNNFYPYFYYRDEKGDINTIDGNKATKFECRYPGEVKDLRENYDKTYEADILYVNRYIIDKINKLQKEKIRKCYIDIEIAKTSKGYEPATEANNPILCIGCYDNFTNEYWQVNLSQYETEKAMMLDFLKYIKNTNPDILIAWGGDRFDFPFIINRLTKLKIDPCELSRLNKNCYFSQSKKYSYKFKSKIFGRICFDLLNGYKKISQGSRESWSLEYISKYELKELGGKEKYKGDLDELYKNDLPKFLKYNKRDVELMILIDNKLRIIEFFDEIRRLCFCTFEDVFMNSKIADCLCLKYAKEHNFVLPTTIPQKYEKFQGAFTFQCIPKLYKNIAIMDMKSLYPAIMVGFNTSYETLLDTKEEGCINVDEKYFFKKQSGIIPSIVRPLLQKRAEEIKLMNEAVPDSLEYNSYDITQYALKVIANSFYGVLGQSVYRLYNFKVAESVTYVARKIIKEVHTWFEAKGLKVIYGDTDSAFIEMGDKSIQDIINLNKEINIYFKTYFKQFNVPDENNIMELQFEKVFKTLFFKIKADGTGAKKKYCGKIIWNKGKETNKMHITGFESKRSDTPAIGRIFITDILTLIVEEKQKDEIDIAVDLFRNKILNGGFTGEELGLPISINKDLKNYENQIHAKAARAANINNNENITSGDKIKYIYITGQEKVIAFKENFPIGYTVDYDAMVRRIVDLKISPLYQSLGWEYKYNIKNNNSRKSKKMSKIKFKQLKLF